MLTIKKVLIIRFSSFGDVVQSLSIPSAIHRDYPKSEIHFITRKEFSPLLNLHPHISKIISFDRKNGLWGLIKLAWILRHEKYSHVYDAHNNLRSHILCMILAIPFFRTQILRRSIFRWKRFLLFKLQINKFEMPFSGQRDLLTPLSHWGISKSLPYPPVIFCDPKIEESIKSKIPFTNYIALAPSAAHFLKRWPKNYWIELIESLPDKNFILLGGTEDRFIEELVPPHSQSVINKAGKTDFAETIAIIKNCELLICNDTGVLHVAEQLGKKAIALMGPAPFGFPSRPTTRILELNLLCRPCSKHGQGPCKNKIYHQCLVDIKPSDVTREVLRQ